MRDIAMVGSGVQSILDELAVSYSRYRFGAKQQEKVFRRLGDALTGGMDDRSALERLFEIYSKNGKKPDRIEAVAVNHWLNEMGNGKSFAKSCEGWLSSSHHCLINAGEKGGDLGQACYQVADAIELSRDLLGQIGSAVAGPTGIMLFIILIVVFIGNVIIPLFEGFSSNGEMPFLPSLIGGIGLFISGNWLSITLIAAAGAFAFYLSLSRYAGSFRWVYDNAPIVKLYRIFTGITFMQSVVSMSKSAQPVSKAVEVLAEAGTPYLRSRLEPVLTNMANGKSFSAALIATDLDFPDAELIGDIQLYSETNRIKEGLEHLVTTWIRNTRKDIEKLSARLRLIAMFVIGLSLLLIISTLLQVVTLLNFDGVSF